MKAKTHEYQIVVVEDNPGDYLLVEDYLHEQIKRPNLIHFTNFRQADEFFNSGNIVPDIVLLDLSLPDIDKESLILRAAELNKIFPVTILTGFADLDFAIKSLGLGLSDYLVKDTINSLVLYKSIIYAVERFRFTRSLLDSEKRYMELFQLSPAPVWLFDPNTLRFLDVNQAAIRTYGYSKSEFLEMTLLDIRPETDHTKLNVIIDQMKESDTYHFPEYLVHKRKDGSTMHVEVISSTINYNGVNALIVLSTDVTQRIAYLKAIEEQNKKLREIAWTQSHIVRAPVARLMGLVDILDNGNLSESEKKQMLAYIFSSAQEIDQIIREIVKNSQTMFDTNE